MVPQVLMNAPRFVVFVCYNPEARRAEGSGAATKRLNHGWTQINADFTEGNEVARLTITGRPRRPNLLGSTGIKLVRISEPRCLVCYNPEEQSRCASTTVRCQSGASCQ